MSNARMLPFGEKFTGLCAQLLDSFEDGVYQKQTITCILEEILINNAPKRLEYGWSNWRHTADSYHTNLK